MLAQVIWVGFGVGFLFWIGSCGHMVSSSLSLFACSRSPILFIRYALVSALSMLLFLVAPVSLMTSAAQSAASSMSQIRVFLAASSSSNISSSLILIQSNVHSSSIVICSSGGLSIPGTSLSIMSWQLKGFTGWCLAFALGVWLFPYPSRGPMGEGVAGLDVGWSSMSRPSSSSIALLFHGFGAFMLSSKEDALFGCVWVLVRLTSCSLCMSDASDGTLLPDLVLLPLPDFWDSGFVLLARVWYSCRGMFILYFNLVLFFSIVPSSVAEPIQDPAHPPLWEFLCSAML